LIGTGGIGTGTFFVLRGNHTLGREESRGGRFLDRRDYCKLHIITHYMCALMGRAFKTVPIGLVGDDAAGREILAEMQADGLGVDNIGVLKGEQTLHGISILYPDGTGGNLTVEDSASSKMVPARIQQAEPEFAAYAGSGIALTVPEVPLDARQELLRIGAKYDFLRVAACTSGEIASALELGLLSSTDLLALNAHEAATLGDVPGEPSAERVVDAAVARLLQVQPSAQMSITAGREGSWVWDGRALAHLPAYAVQAVNTAGAGDAHLAGILVGLATGLPLQEAHEIGALVGALKVTSEHTIDKELDRVSLRALAATQHATLCSSVRSLLEA
jgi:ribokinase